MLAEVTLRLKDGSIVTDLWSTPIFSWELEAERSNVLLLYGSDVSEIEIEPAEEEDSFERDPKEDLDIENMRELQRKQARS